MSPMLATVLVVVAGIAVCVAVAAVYLSLRTHANPPIILTASGEPCPPAYLDRHCVYCTHFDLEEGQAQIAAFPAFKEVARHIPPADMSKGNAGRELDDPLRIPQKVDFSQFGLCLLRHEGIWGGWDAKRRVLTVLKTPEGDQPDCWTAR